MCRLHDDTPSLMRVWFLELWEGCVAQYAVYSHRAMGAISQGGYWHWISKRRGLGIGCWSLGNCNSWHLWQLSPLQLDLRIQLCMVVRMCVCLLVCICMYMHVWSYIPHRNFRNISVIFLFITEKLCQYDTNYGISLS